MAADYLRNYIGKDYDEPYEPGGCFCYYKLKVTK